MRRRRVFQIIVLLLGVLLLPLWIPGPDGKPVMRWQDWLPSRDTYVAVDRLWKQLRGWSNDTLAGFAGDDASLYRWQDAQGVWHFSDQRPEGVAAQSMERPELHNVTAFPKQERQAGSSVISDSRMTPSIDAGVVHQLQEQVRQRFNSSDDNDGSQ